MTKEEKAKLAHEILLIRQDIENLYQMTYSAFVESTNTFGKGMQPIMMESVNISKRLMEIEDKIYREVEE